MPGGETDAAAAERDKYMLASLEREERAAKSASEPTAPIK